MKKFVLSIILLYSFVVIAQGISPVLNSNGKENERPRTVLLEGFTSSSCAPCVSGNQNLKNVMEENQGRYALVKYQMNFPGAGDPYYTSEAGVRYSFNGVSGVPWLRLDGNNGMHTGDLTNTYLKNLQANPAYMDLDVEYHLEGKKIFAKATIDPFIDFSGDNLRLFIAIVESITHENKTTNGERDFIQVMKKFMPDTNGIPIGNLTANVPFVVEQEWEFKGNYRCPPNSSSPINHDIEHSVENFDNLTIVAWVQNTQSKVSHQACNGRKKFAVIQYSTVNDFGKISATINGENFEQGTLVETGVNVNFTAAPYEGYEVKQWKVNESIVSNNTDNELVVYFDKNLDVTVEFQTTHLITNFSAANNNGTIIASVNDDTIESGDLIRRGSKVVFDATPNEHFRVLAWRYNGGLVLGNTTNQFIIESLTGDETATVLVEFEATHFSVNYNAVNGEFGTLTATANGETIESGDNVIRGAKMVFTATPNEDFKIKQWKNNNVIIYGYTANEFNIISLSNSANVTVEFAHESKFIVSIETNPKDAGTVTGAGLYDPDKEVSVSAIPNDGWKFVNWTKDDEIVSDKEDYTFIVSDDITLVANFEVYENVTSCTLSKVTLYPNPFKDEINISNSGLVKSIQITNLSGQKVKTSAFNNGTISTKELAQGVYFVIVERFDNKIEVFKMLKK